VDDRQRPESERELDDEARARIVAMRDAGQSWKEIQAAYGLTRQQARYAYQLGKRRERRERRRAEE
jgi:uncharacterized protein (DUF433 family)